MLSPPGPWGGEWAVPGMGSAGHGHSAGTQPSPLALALPPCRGATRPCVLLSIGRASLASAKLRCWGSLGLAVGDRGDWAQENPSQVSTMPPPHHFARCKLVCHGRGSWAAGRISIHGGAGGGLTPGMSHANGGQGRGTSQPAQVSSRPHVQPGTAELLLRPLAPPKPDAQSPSTCPPQPPPSLAGMRLAGASKLPAQLPDGGTRVLRSYWSTPLLQVTFPWDAQGAQPAGSLLKGNVLCLTCKAPGGQGPACSCLAPVGWRSAWVS